MLEVLVATVLMQAPVADPSAELARGRAAAQAGDLDAAELHLRRATETFPTWGLAQLELAAVLLAKGPSTAGLVHALATARTLEPHNPRVWHLTGQWHEQKNEPDAAIAAYRRAVDLRPDLLEARERLGVLLVHAGRYEEAIPELSAVTAKRPEEWGLRATLAEALERGGRLADAERELKAVAEGGPSPAIFFRRLGQFYERTGQHKQAAEAFRRADGGRPAPKRMRSLPASKW